MSTRGLELFFLVSTAMMERDVTAEGFDVAPLMMSTSPTVALLGSMACTLTGTPQGEAVDTALEALLEGATMFNALIVAVAADRQEDVADFRRDVIARARAFYEQ
jgi:hypothetical protein